MNNAQRDGMEAMKHHPAEYPSNRDLMERVHQIQNDLNEAVNRLNERIDELEQPYDEGKDI